MPIYTNFKTVEIFQKVPKNAFFGRAQILESSENHLGFFENAPPPQEILRSSPGEIYYAQDGIFIQTY